MSETATTTVEPIFSVVSGNPTPEELAALVLVLGAAVAGEDDARDGAVTSWNHRARTLGVRPMAARQRSPQAWRAATQFR